MSIILATSNNTGIETASREVVNQGKFCVGLEVTQMPTKTTYDIGDTLDLSGLVISAVYTDGTKEVVTSSCTFNPAAGTQIIEKTTIQVSYTDTLVYTTSFNVLSSIEIVPWATGTDQEIKNMLDAHYDGRLNIHDYWSVDQARVVSVGAMTATHVGETHAAQNVEIVLADATCTGFKITGTNTTPAFMWNMADCFKETGYMNPTATNVGGWAGGARRLWTNDECYNAFPAGFRSFIKQFTWSTYGGSGASPTLTSCNDHMALPPAKAIFGTAGGSHADEAALYSRWQWFIDHGTIKKVNGSPSTWWEASANGGNATYFCFVRTGGSANNDIASNSNGLSVFGCI